jgi:hypothetical protein
VGLIKIKKEEKELPKVFFFPFLLNFLVQLICRLVQQEKRPQQRSLLLLLHSLV